MIEKTRPLLGCLWWDWLLLIPAGIFFGWLIGDVIGGAIIGTGVGWWRRIDNIKNGRV